MNSSRFEEEYLRATKEAEKIEAVLGGLTKKNQAQVLKIGFSCFAMKQKDWQCGLKGERLWCDNWGSFQCHRQAWGEGESVQQCRGRGFLSPLKLTWVMFYIWYEFIWLLFYLSLKVGSATRRIFLLENEADMRENRLATEVKNKIILLVFVFEKQHRNMNFLQVSSLLRACLRADEQITQRNKLELDISTNEEDIGGFLKQSKILIFLQVIITGKKLVVTGRMLEQFGVIFFLQRIDFSCVRR